MRRVFSGLVVLVFLLFTACKSKEKFQIAYGGSACGSPISIAYLNGYYADEGLDIELVSGVSFETIRSYLAAGKMPVINGDFQFFPAVYNGIDVKLISGLHEGCIKILVPNDSDIKTVADLRGKRIIVDEIGGTPMSVASVAVGDAGIDPQKEITWLPFPSDQEIQALEKGEGDVVALWDPFATEAEQTGKYRTLIDIATDPLFAGRNCCFLFASGKLVKERPDVVAKTLRAISRAVEYEGKYPDESAKKLIEAKKVSTDNEKLLATLLSSFHYEHHYTQEHNAKAKDDAVYFAQKIKETGYLPQDIDVQEFVDNMYVDIFALEAEAKNKTQ
ncbi:MAG: ABC transporter substrate-binding protein [Spirochaetaceae bacterium]|nr:ABC transporter substrate-binding protein [Spirochaetaceae bacterium]